MAAPTTGLDGRNYFSFSVANNAAVVYHVGVNGGTKTAWYDYKNNVPVRPAFPSGGVYGDTDLHATPTSKYTAAIPDFFVASITTFCYSELTVTPSCSAPFSGLPLGGTGTVQYSAQLVSKDGACKNSKVVMYSYTPRENDLFATLHQVLGIERERSFTTPAGRPIKLNEGAPIARGSRA